MHRETVKWVVVLALCAVASKAGATTLYLGAWSKHLDGGSYNETHDLVAVEHNRWIAGTLVNSYNDRTYIAGHGWDLAQGNDWRFRLYAGASYGYRSCEAGETGDSAKVCPLLVPELTYTKYRVKPAVMLFGGAVALSLKIAL